MADSANTSAPKPSEPLMPSATLNAETLKKWAGIRMAHEAVMMQDAQEILRLNRDGIKHHQTNMATMPGDKQTAEDDMGNIRVGDEIHYHQQQQAANGLSSLAKMGLVGAGLAIGGPLAGLATYLATKPATTIQAEPGPDYLGGTQLLPPIVETKP